MAHKFKFQNLDFDICILTFRLDSCSVAEHDSIPSSKNLTKKGGCR